MEELKIRNILEHIESYSREPGTLDSNASGMRITCTISYRMVTVVATVILDTLPGML